MKLGQWISEARARLSLEGSPTPAADVKSIACHVLGVDASWLIIHDEYVLEPFQEKKLNEMLGSRCSGMPVAYIVGHRGFWDLDLKCDKCTLIPQPDTETLVEVALKYVPQGGRVLDLATGTGAVALALKSERPDLRVEGCDIVSDAVELARQNAVLNGFDVKFYISDWFSEVDGQFDLITANPPYVAENDPHLACGDVRFEPVTALVAEDEGLADLRHIISAAGEFLVDGGVLLLEHGYNQAQPVRDMFLSFDYESIGTVADLGGNPRVTGGIKRKSIH